MVLGTSQFTTAISRLHQIYIKKKEKEQILTLISQPDRVGEDLKFMWSTMQVMHYLPTLKKQTYYPHPKSWEKECAGSLVFL